MDRFPSTPSRALFPRKRALLSPALALALLALAASACGQEGIPLVSTSGDEASGTPSSAGSSGAGGAASTSATSSTSTSSSSSGGGGGGVPEGQPLTVVDWNVHDFFDTVGTLGNDALSPADYQIKRQAIGAAIKAMNPDVIVLQEIENKTVLDDLNQAELGGVYTSSWLFDTSDIREIALLSKITAEPVISHKNDVFPGPGGLNYDYTRDCLEAHLTVNGHKVVLLGVHFKSKVPPDDVDRRLAEAQHTRAIADAITAQDPSTGIVVLGDYNDFPASPPYLAVQGAAPNLFFDVAEAAPAAERYSFIFQGVKQLIDHQMANPVMTMALDPSSVTLKHGPVFDTNKYASDHSPIVATYRFKDPGAISSPP